MAATDWQAIWEFLQTTPARTVIGLTVLAILSVIGYYIVRATRDSMDFSSPSANELLADFRQLRESERMSEIEFRRIKQTLGEQIRGETRDVGGER